MESLHPPPKTDSASLICNHNNLCWGVMFRPPWGFQADVLPHELPTHPPQLPKHVTPLGCNKSLAPATPSAAELHRKRGISATTQV